MSIDFKRAVKKRIPREKRIAAIDRLAERGERTNLALLVRMGGLRGEFRRYALERLVERTATEQLQSLSEDRSVPGPLRRRAAEPL